MIKYMCEWVTNSFMHLHSRMSATMDCKKILYNFIKRRLQQQSEFESYIQHINEFSSTNEEDELIWSLCARFEEKYAERVSLLLDRLNTIDDPSGIKCLLDNLFSSSSFSVGSFVVSMTFVAYLVDKCLRDRLPFQTIDDIVDEVGNRLNEEIPKRGGWNHLIGRKTTNWACIAKLAAVTMLCFWFYK